MSPTFASFRHHDYRLYWSGMFVSNVGTWMQRVAQDWLVLVVLGGGAGAVGITTGLQFLPMLLVVPFGGLLADKFPKRKLLMATNAFLGVVGLTLGVLTLTGVAQVWHVYVLAFLLGVGTAFDNPARQAFVSEVVGKDDLANAVALNSASFNAARLIGPAVAGGLIALIGTGWVFVLNGLSFLAPIVVLMLMHRTRDLRPKGGDEEGVIQRLAEGVRYVRSRPDIVMVMVVMFGVGTFGMNFQMTMALMATEIYGKGPGEYGILGSIMAIGTLTGALVAARRRVPRRRIVLLGAITFGVFELASGFAPTYALFAAALVPIGWTAMTVMTSANAYVQTTVPQYVRGRVMSLYMMVFMGGTPIGAPVIGWIAGQWGAQWSLWGGGALTVVFTLFAVLVFAPRSGITVRPRLRPRPGWSVYVTPPVDETTGRASDVQDPDGVRAGDGAPRSPDVQGTDEARNGVRPAA